MNFDLSRQSRKDEPKGTTLVRDSSSGGAGVKSDGRSSKSARDVARTGPQI